MSKVTEVNQPDPRSTAITRARYQRIAAIYDPMETMAERRYLPWRKRLWSLVRASSVLEIGVGTGKNMAFYPKTLQMTAIDLTPRMLERAQKRATALNLDVNLQLGDVQALQFPDGSFDAAVATFVFCSVPDPVLGLQELGRVVKPGGQVLLLEHMRPSSRIFGLLMDALNPLVVRMMGANINRRTVENVQKAGLELINVEDLGKEGIFKFIEARVKPG